MFSAAKILPVLFVVLLRNTVDQYTFYERKSN